jgi:cyanophycinase
LELAGGERAEVLIIPVASDFPEFAADIYTQAFRNLGIAAPRILRATSRQDVFQANPDELLDGITGVFITGGDQMRLVSTLGGTEFAAKLRRMVRETELVLAGTSAGAAGMSTSMIVRGETTSKPYKSAVRLSPGLGFLKNIIIDQHFSERGRISRLITAVSYNPYNLGIGIDENTAIILDSKGVMQVFGEGTVTVVDGSSISYNEIAEVAETEAFGVCGIRLHILRDGLVWKGILYSRVKNSFSRTLVKIPASFVPNNTPKSQKHSKIYGNIGNSHSSGTELLERILEEADHNAPRYRRI